MSSVSNTLKSRQVTKFIFQSVKQFPKIYLIFDALDECEDISSQSKLIDFINTATQLEPVIRILFTSHPQLSNSSFESHNTIVVRSYDTDIETFARVMIKYKHYSSLLQNEIVSKI